ncbi:hypothetical protein LTR62_001188 [Meristemomyces frigidus]|uniref:SET domain-containing protein n=1 Tax=Meristemomyces frigidus TaxID=1508187 RepID=A0AAN7YLV4_9PEZI|nr:hypothetical protein LTR62_001188 [Meristemomyces frigidus]
MANQEKSLASKANNAQDIEVPENWPQDIVYMTDQTYSSAVTDEQRIALSRTLSDDATWTQVRSEALASMRNNINICIISDEKHPARGQRGLFAAQNLAPDSFIVLYVGHVHTNALSDTDPKSDYDLNLDGEIGLSVDAARGGNESRCTNDYRGIADRPNAEFRDCYVQVPSTKRVGGTKWERRVAIFVLSAGNAGKRKGGIRAGEEVLVSYGKGYWEARKRLAGFRKDEEMLRVANAALEE